MIKRIITLIRKDLKTRFRHVGHTFYKDAAKCNSDLYCYVDKIDQKAYEEFIEKIQYYGLNRNYPLNYISEWITHGHRLYITIQHIRELSAEFPNDAICIETGGNTLVTDLFKDYLEKFEWVNTKCDLRYDWEIEENFADLIVATEVIEHLSDIPEGFQDAFRKTGLINFLNEAHRVLKQNALLFITTPNAASVLQLAALLNGYSPWFFDLHIHEYTIQELKQILENCGFVIEKAITIHCLTTHRKDDFTFLFNVLLKNNFEVSDRGDDIFLVARKR